MGKTLFIGACIFILVDLAFAQQAGMSMPQKATKQDSQSEKIELIKTWGEIKYVAPSGLNLPFGLPTGVKISLSGPGYKTVLETKDEISSAFASGKFYFANVPCGAPMKFMLEYVTITGTNLVWNGTYKFDKPKLNFVQKVWSGENKAEEIAGYIGTFTITEEKITAEQKSK